MDVGTIQDILNDNGFPCGGVDGVLGPRTRGAIMHFQLAFNNGEWLAVDGIPGPKTQAALAKLPRLSANFVVDEVRSKGNGDCYVRRELLRAMEEFRTKLGRPVGVLSAYRDPVHNRRVGGAKNSMHVEGFAWDPGGLYCSVEDAVEMAIFSGIGNRSGMFAHGDMRHLSTENQTPGASPQHPVIWRY